MPLICCVGGDSQSRANDNLIKSDKGTDKESTDKEIKTGIEITKFLSIPIHSLNL